MTKKMTKTYPREFDWEVRISFCPFEDKYSRDEAYRQWVNSYIKGLAEKMKKEGKLLSST